MTELINRWMPGYEFDPVLAVPVTIGAVTLLLSAIALWIFARTRRQLRAVSALEERLDVVNHSLTLLTDTTESCFKALSMQLQFMQTQNVLRPTPRADVAAKPRQAAVESARTRKTIGAPRRRAAIEAMTAQSAGSAGPAHVNGGAERPVSPLVAFLS